MSEPGGGDNPGTTSGSSSGNNEQPGGNGGRNRSVSRDRGNSGDHTRKFIGNITSLPVLGTRSEQRITHDFIVFQRDVLTYVLDKFIFGADISIVVRHLRDPMAEVMQEMPKLRGLMMDYGIDPTPPAVGEKR